MSKYLDNTGLAYFWGKIDTSKQDTIRVNPAGTYVPSAGELVVDGGQIKIGDGTTAVSALEPVGGGGVEVIRL